MSKSFKAFGFEYSLIIFIWFPLNFITKIHKKNIISFINYANQYRKFETAFSCRYIQFTHKNSYYLRLKNKKIDCSLKIIRRKNLMKN